jgi:hypothetical protein
MMRLAVLLGVMSVASMSAFATIPTTDSCANATGNVVLTTYNTDTNILCGDKVFTNFTGPSGGSVTISENSATSYEVVFKAPIGGISTAFSYGFTVTVDTAVCSHCVITEIQQNMQTTQFGNTGFQIPNGSTGVNTINNGGVFTPSTTNALVDGNQNADAKPLNNTTYTLGFAYNPTGNSGPAGLFLNLDDVITQSSVPEPMTFSLLGAGLLGLGLLRKRISRS